MKEFKDTLSEERYYAKGENQWCHIADRVAQYLGNSPEEIKEFFEMIESKRALPSSPVLMNAGFGGYLSACSFVPMEDNMESIMEALNAAVKIQRWGGGTGFNFSNLRPEGDAISSGGTSSGPLAFLHGLNAWSLAIKQGGKRRGANMGLLSMAHPQIMDFIDAKKTPGELSAFNLSVIADNRLFGEKLIPKINPRTNQIVGFTDPRELLDKIANSIWEHGEPGLVFWDTINKDNRTPWLGDFDGINPCGEIPLRKWSSCTLGSINLYAHYDQETNEFDYAQLIKTALTMTVLLNRVLDKNNYPLPQMREAALKTRKIGIGVMGFADLLFAMGILYGSNECLELIDLIMNVIETNTHLESLRLAEIDGPYPAWIDGQPPFRNAQIISIAPTGSIGILADVSSGIEPIPYWEFTYDRETGETVTLRNRYMKDTDDKLPRIGNYLVTAQEVPPHSHIKVQARFQLYVDQSISKTINLPEETTKDQVKELIKLAYISGCKGLTMYREDSTRKSFIKKVDNCSECETGVCAVGET